MPVCAASPQIRGDLTTQSKCGCQLGCDHVQFCCQETHLTADEPPARAGLRKPRQGPAFAVPASLHPTSSSAWTQGSRAGGHPPPTHPQAKTWSLAGPRPVSSPTQRPPGLRTHDLPLIECATAVGGRQGGGTFLQVPRLVPILSGAADGDGVDAVGVSVAGAVVALSASISRGPDKNGASSFAALSVGGGEVREASQMALHLPAADGILPGPI